MAVTLTRLPTSVEDYLAGEERSEIRHEYLDGEVYAMVGGTRAHNLIVSNLMVTIGAHLQDGPCQIFSQGFKVRVASANAFYYPDLFVTCDSTDHSELSSETPCLIIEVLSISTEAVDRREKRQNYQNLPSLVEYVLVDPWSRVIEVYRRSASDSWLVSHVDEGGMLDLSSIAFSLRHSAVFRGVPREIRDGIR